MKSIKLVVAYNNRVISIPFKNVALIDEFTTYYDNNTDIGIALNEILDLKLKDTTVKSIYICKTKEKKVGDKEYNEYLPIKYSTDNFEYDSVLNNYIDYLKKNTQILQQKNTPLNIIMNNYMKKYSKIYLTETDIERIAILYLKNSSTSYSYERCRSAYFTLLKANYKIKTKKETKYNPLNRTDLTKYNSEDEFFEYLIHYSTINEETKAHAMDLLASVPLEEIEKNIHNHDYGLFDNRHINHKRNFYDDAMLLQALTNMTIQELVDLINNYQIKAKERTKK